MPESECPEDFTVAISWAQGFEKKALSFAHEHRLPIINELPSWRGLCFELTTDGWLLTDPGGEMDKPFTLEFLGRRTSSGRDPLLKALGKHSKVLDLTAGWGGDALHIAASGCSVVAVERNPVVFQLLLQAQQRLHEPELAERLLFLNLDSASMKFKQQLIDQLPTESEFDLVYLDPMFANKQTGRAKAKKPMYLMQKLADIPSMENEQKLLDNALRIANKRVVVKRSLKAPYLDNRKPQGSISSKLLRFDLYKP